MKIRPFIFKKVPYVLYCTVLYGKVQEALLLWVKNYKLRFVHIRYCTVRYKKNMICTFLKKNVGTVRYGTVPVRSHSVFCSWKIIRTLWNNFCTILYNMLTLSSDRCQLSVASCQKCQESSECFFRFENVRYDTIVTEMYLTSTVD